MCRFNITLVACATFADRNNIVCFTILANRHRNARDPLIPTTRSLRRNSISHWPFRFTTHSVVIWNQNMFFFFTVHGYGTFNKSFKNQLTKRRLHWIGFLCYFICKKLWLLHRLVFLFGICSKKISNLNLSVVTSDKRNKKSRSVCSDFNTV